jgi:4-amino-4-deoxy-L-arabinose transferase-like glycosyltransferase
MKALIIIKENYILTSILILAAVLRFYHLDFQSIWLDEIHTLIEGNPKMSYKEFHDIMILREQMPHLYFYSVKAFSFIFGHTTFIVRMFSAIIGVLTVYSIYLLGKEIYNKKVGLIAATFLAVNYFHISYSQEARPYILLSLFTVLAFYRLIIFIKDSTIKNAILYGIFTSLMINTHFFGLFVVVSQFILLLYFLFELPKNERKKYFLASSLSGFVALFLWIPSIKIFLIVAEIKSFWIQPPTLEVYTGLFREFFGNAESVVFIAYLLGTYYFIKVFSENKKDDTPCIHSKNVFSFIIIIVWIFTVLFIPFIRTYLDIPMIISRYFISVLPAAILILAIAIANIKVHKIQLIVIVIFVIASLTDLIAVKDYYNKISKTQYREITQNIIQKNKRNAIIVSPWGWHLRYFFSNEKVKMITKEQTLQEFVDDMKTGVTKKKDFWFMGAHFQNYELTAESEAYLNSNFNQIESLKYFDTWARYYSPKAGIEKTFVLNINEFEPIKSDNDSNILLFSNSTTKSKPNVLEPGNYRLALKARSSPEPKINNENAHLTISLNGKRIGAYFLSEKEEKIDYFQFDVTETAEYTIELTFDNDLVLNNSDRNALVFSATVEKVKK